MEPSKEREIEALLKEELQLSKENNKLLKKIRRGSVMSFWFRILFFVLVTGGAYYTYQTYLRGYLEQVISAYNEIQKGVEQVQELPKKIGL